MNEEQARKKYLKAHPEALKQVEEYKPDPPPTGPNGPGRPNGIAAEVSEGQRGQNQAGELVTLVEESGAELFRDQYKEPWACIPSGEHQDIVKVRGRFLRRWLAGQFWKAKSKAAPSETIRAAMNVLEAKAVFDGKQHPLHVRLAWDGDDLWYDLMPKAVRITKDGWEIENRPPILFQHYAGQKPQLPPRRGGRIADVLGYVNLPGESVKEERLLFLVQLIAYAVPNIPRPICVATGTKGNAKTTLGRIIQEHADPTEEDVLTFPDSPREFVQTMAHRHFVTFDNLSALPKWGSDALCRAVTGAGFTKRELFSDDEDILYSFRRGIAINSISGVARASDLLDRCLIYSLPELEIHEQETDFWARFEVDKPLLLGGLFDALSAAIRIKKTMPRVKTTARMADFAVWGMAITEALGYRREDFLGPLARNAYLIQKEAVQASYVAVCLLKLLEDHQEEGVEGTPTHLLKEVKRVAPEARVDEKSLPRNAVWFSRKLKEVCKDLRAYGWEVSEDRGDDRRISITRSQRPENTVNGVGTDGNRDSEPTNIQINHADTANYRGGQVPDSKDSNDGISPTSIHRQVVADGETEALVAEPASGHQDGDTIVEDL